MSCEGVIILKRSRKIFFGRKKVGGIVTKRRGKAYGSVKLRGKKRNSSAIFDKGAPWSSDEMDAAEVGGRRKSEIRERDNFFELLSKVQDSRYNNQRYTLKAGSMTDETVDDVFEDSKSERANSISGKPLTNGILSNGRASHYTKRDIPTVEVTDSPTLHRLHKAASVGSVSGFSEDSSIKSPDEGRPSSAGSRSIKGREASSESPTQSLTSVTEVVVSPSRKSMEALKKVINSEGPYPPLIQPPDGGYWIQNGEYEVACGEDGVWRAPEISTEHYTIQADKTAAVYGNYFRKQDHQNFITRDSKNGPIILSLKLEEDYQGTLARVLVRTQKETVYKILPSSQLPNRKVEPEEYIKIAMGTPGADVDKALPVVAPKATELLQKFDEHPLAKTHKFGIIYQKFGQTSEEELFANVDHPEPLVEFLEMLGDKVELKGFEGYRGGLDVTNNQTGEHSIYTEFHDRKIMFHVSTLLPHDQGDTQYVQKKRHIGNDIVVIVFQEANTPFCPNMIRSHFVHSYIVVQVEHPNTDHTVYKVAITAKDEVPDFGPTLPDPAIFQKGPEFRDWLLMKVLNAEFNCHQASSFKKLSTRTRNQLYLHLVEEVSQCVEEVDGSLLSKELTASLECSTAPSPDVGISSRSKKRRRTLTGMFSKKEVNVPSPHLGALSKRKSVSGSPKVSRKGNTDSSPARHVLAGSTPDLMEETEHLLDLEDSQIEHKKEKSNIVRKLSTFRRNQDPFKEKEKKKPKRTASVNVPRHSVAEYRQKRGKTTASPSNKRRHKRFDSSEESSIASAGALGGSVPFDLPGAVDKDERTRLSKYQFENTLADRTSSTLTLEDVDVGISISPHQLGELRHAVDVAIQCTPGHSSVTHYSPLSSPRPHVKAEHSKRIYSVNSLSVIPRSDRSQSVPSTPDKQRRATGGRAFFPVGGQSPTLDHSLGSDQRSTNRQSNSSRLSGEHQIVDEKLLYRVESLESVSTEPDEMYSSLLHSLDSVSSDVARLRELNFTLTRENVKFASQNRDLKARYLSMKDQLASAQQQIKELNLKIEQSQLLAQLSPASPQD